MKTLLTLICSFALISMSGAAQQDEEGHNQGKKKGGGNAGAQPPAVQATTVTPKVRGQHSNAKFNTQGAATTRNARFKTQGTATSRMQHDPTINQGGGSLSTVQSNGNAASTKFNKGKLSARTNGAGNFKGNFQKRHFNLSNNPNPRYQAVRFNGNYRINGAQNWRGSNYVVFRNYRPQWHDQGWWRSHHSRITFVFGAPYYWDSGYWYPTWGYNPGANYYYDGPIYSGNPEMDPAQVVANVQAALQEQGYYHGEVDGILGPETRAGLAEFQSAQGLEPTGTVDEPTLQTLGMV